VTSGTPASARLTGQVAFAPSASSRKLLSSSPGTRPCVTSSIFVIVGTPSTGRSVTDASVSIESAAASSPFAAYACVDTWLTDFRNDLPKIDVPTLAVHGTADRILPYVATARRLPGLIKDLRLVTVEGGPHNVCWTHYDEVNAALLEFLAS
jgi:pimeloyl-ACP methyl ester carboxylesterase